MCARVHTVELQQQRYIGSDRKKLISTSLFSFLLFYYFEHLLFALTMERELAERKKQK